jgi:DNA processing protein
LTEKLVGELVETNATIVSGLAYGIDVTAHRASLKFGIPTIGCLAHGLDRIYPKVHTNTAMEMLENGALVTDFPIGTKPDRENFPKRNRIVAGMADATIVVEVGDEYSAGCLQLVKSHKAALITSAKDVLKALQWDLDQKPKKQMSQARLLIDLTEEQEKVVAVLRNQEHSIDRLTTLSELPINKVASILLELEFAGIISNLPGKIYKLN